MVRQRIKDELPEEVARYVPDEIPEDADVDPDSEPEVEGFLFGAALCEWAIHEKGMEPEEAAKMTQRAVRHGAADAQLQSLDLPTISPN